jgi:hypothetical protein
VNSRQAMISSARPANRLDARGRRAGACLDHAGLSFDHRHQPPHPLIAIDPPRLHAAPVCSVRVMALLGLAVPLMVDAESREV